MRPMPTYDQILALPSGTRVRVAAEQGDENGHLNVRHYLGLYDDAEWAVFGPLGIGAEHAVAGLGGLFALEQHLSYRREVLVGDEVSVALRIVARTTRMVHLVSYLANHTRREVAGCMEALDAYVDFATRGLAALPDPAVSALGDLVAQAEALPWQPSLSGSIVPR